MNNNSQEPDLIPTDWNLSDGAIIKVIGVGGGGNNAVNYMENLGITGVDFIICNTDGQVLKKSPIRNKVQLGEELTRGRGAGCDPEVGKQAAVESIDKIRAMLDDNTEMVFITAGMGGGTGTGAAPIIAKAAKDMDILTVGIVTIPFKDEGLAPTRRAIEGINQLKDQVDSLLIISNDKLYEIYGELRVSEAFKKADEVLATAAKGIAEIITKPGYINVDFADVKKVMKNSGVALLGTGVAAGENRAIRAVEAALTSPLLNNNSIKGATNILINITSGKEKEITLSELGDIMNYIQGEAGSVENMKRGIVYDEAIGDKISITVVATGFRMNDIPELNGYKVSSVGDKNEIERVQIDEDFDSRQTSLNFVDNSNVEFKIHEADSNSNSTENTETETATNNESAKNANNSKLTGLKKEQIVYLESVPAYLRKGTKINTEEQISDKNEISHETLEENEDGKFTLRSNNSYLNPGVD